MNGYDAQDMAAQGADGFRNGYQAGYADAVKAIEAAQPAAAQESAPWRDHDAAIDAKALSTATEIALMWGQDRSQFISRIQVAVIDAMRWVKGGLQPAAAQEAVRQPDGYHYRYPNLYGTDTCIRKNNGEEVNGSKPVEAVPYWYAPVTAAPGIDASPKGNEPRTPIDGCTESNCPRCRTHPDHRGDMEHAGIGRRPPQDSPKGGSDAAAPAAITRMLPEVPESCERPEIGPHPFTGFDVGPFFVHLDLADNEAMTVSGTDDVGDWVVTHRESGFAVQKGIPTHWRAIWLAQQLLAKSSWSGATKGAVLATLSTSVVDEIRVLRADAMHGDCQGQIDTRWASSAQSQAGDAEVQP